MPADVDVLRLLPGAEWRGIRFPVSERSCRHAHEVAKTVIQYFGQQMAEIVAGDNLVIEYTIPFRNGVSMSPYRGALFNEALPAFWTAYLNTEPGPLTDPIRGQFMAIPGSWDEQLDVQKRDGIDVRSCSLRRPSSVPRSSVGSATHSGRTGGRECARSRSPEATLDPGPEPHAGNGPVQSDLRAMTQIANQPGRIAAQLMDVKQRCQKIEDAAVRLKDPKVAAAPVKAARDLNLKATKLATSVLSVKKTIADVQTVRQSVAACASQYGMSLKDLLAINPALARSPFVNSGAIVIHYV